MSQPNLEQLRNQAKELLKAFRAGDVHAVQRVRVISSVEPVKLAHTQLVIARERGFSSWTRLKASLERKPRLSKRQQFVRDLSAELLHVAATDVGRLAARMAIPLRDILAVRTHLLETNRLHLLVDGLLAGLENPEPRVRADCAGALDHFADDRCAKPLRRLLSDPVPRVRRMALHSLSCDACKLAPLEVGDDLIPQLIDIALNDPSVRVRHAAVYNLGASCADARVVNALNLICSRETDQQVIVGAQRALHAAARQG